MKWIVLEENKMSRINSSSLDPPFAVDFPTNGRRPPAGFQRNSYTQLPAIPANGSPQPGPDNQIVSFNGNQSQYNRKPLGRFPSPNDLLDAEEKVKAMEMRLNVTEKSNRALLDEVLRLQNELKVTVRRNEDSLKEEKMSRQQMEAAIKTSNDLILQLSARIKGTEEQLTKEKNAMTSLVHHTKSVEQTVISSQQELKSKKDAQQSRLGDLENGLLETKLAKEKLEKQTQAMLDEIRALKTKIEIQGSDLAAATSELKSKTKRLEDDTRVQVEVLRKHGDQYSQSEHATVHLRGQVESRLSELRDVIVDLRTKQDQESSERRTLEQQLQLKMNELQQGLAEQSRKREEAIHALDMIQREKEHEIETEKLKLQSRLTEGVEDVNKRLLTKEIKLREEMQDKFLQLEKLIQQEQKSRRDYEIDAREETDQRWNGLKKQIDDELNHLREIIKGDRGKNKETLKKLDEGITLLEKQLAENRKQVDKVLTAEIKSRKVHESTTSEKINGVQQKLQLATSALQEAIGGVNGQITNNNEQMKDEVRKMMADNEEANTRTMTDMDTRITALNKKITELGEQIEKKIKELEDANIPNPEEEELKQGNIELTKGLREQVESIHLWQDVTGNSLKELQDTVQRVPNDIYAVEEKQKLLKSDLDSRVSAEADCRIREVQSLKKEIKELREQANKPAKNNGPTVEEMEALNSSVRQLGESIQTVKTVLTMKIQSEQKLRIDELKGLQEDMAKLRVQIEPLVRKNTPDNRSNNDNDNNGNNFISDTDHSVSINQWGVYNITRWMKWKNEWMKLLKKKDGDVLPPSPVLVDMINTSPLHPDQSPEPTSIRQTPDLNNNPSKTSLGSRASNRPGSRAKNTPKASRSNANTPKPSKSEGNTPKPQGSPQPRSKATTPQSSKNDKAKKIDNKGENSRSQLNTPNPEVVTW